MMKSCPYSGHRARPKPRAKTLQSIYLRKSRSTNAGTVSSQASPARLKSEGIEILIAPEHLALLRGATMDFVELPLALKTLWPKSRAQACYDRSQF